MRMRLLCLLTIGWFSCQGQSPIPASVDSAFLRQFQDSSRQQVLVTTQLLLDGPLNLHFPKDSTITSSSNKSYLQVGANYQTDDVYNGRKGNRVVPLLTPTASYIFQNGLQFDLSVGFDVFNPSPQLNQYTMDASYSFSPGNGNYSSSITVSKFIYSDQSASTKGDQKGSVELDNSYDFNFIEPGLYLSWTYGGGSDYNATFQLQHEFDFYKGKVNFTPGASLNAGTQNYYDSYYRHRKYKIDHKDEKPTYEKVEVYGDVLNAGKFQILDYELTAPLNFVTGRWTFNLTPTYAMPVNPADIRVTTSYQGTILRVTTKKEKLSNTLYTQIGLTYDF